MSNDVTHWLAEIKALKQQLAELQQNYEAVVASEAKWRQMYTTEAQQRRTENKLAQQQNEVLKAQIGQIKASPLSPPDDDSAMQAIEKDLTQIQSHKELRAKLAEVILERDRLRDALKAEQASHEQTRKNLTTVIGDTIDKLTKERAKNNPG